MSWRGIPGYPRYEIKLNGMVRRSTDSGGYENVVTIKSVRNVVHLTHLGSRKLCKIARLLLITFVGPPPENKPYACHKNDDKLDDRLDNLYWGSPLDNAADAVNNGRYDAMKIKMVRTKRLRRPTHCPSGHEYTHDNTRTDKRGAIICKQCSREKALAFYYKKRQQQCQISI